MSAHGFDYVPLDKGIPGPTVESEVGKAVSDRLEATRVVEEPERGSLVSFESRMRRSSGALHVTRRTKTFANNKVASKAVVPC